MAKSHHDVGVAFGNLTAANGSRMSTIKVQPVSPIQDDTHAHYNKPFYLVQTGVSYRTVVARIMRNVHTKRNELWITPQRYSNSTKRNELWITPQRYSNSTERHKSYFTSGFCKVHGYDSDDIYVTTCVDNSQDRHHPDHVLNTIGLINHTLKDVNLPRLREATRRGTIASCLHHANKVMRNFSNNIPLDLIDAPALYELQTTIGFLTTTAAIADIDELRAAVKGHLALLEAS
jgi:hypothetical protein